jgi:hypothetical protein
MKKKCGAIVMLIGKVLLCGMLAACSSSPKAPPVDLTGITTYFVRADGSDTNTGINEDVPFKTLAKAVEAAAKTRVKTITIIGVLNEETVIQGTDPSVIKITKIMVTGGQDMAKVLAKQQGVARIQGGYDVKDPEEILITGKPDATEAEKAVLKGLPDKAAALTIFRSTVRLEHIAINNAVTTGSPVQLGFACLTLGKGVKISNNKPYGEIYATGSLVIMRDDAEVSNNEANDGGMYLDNGSVLAMFDNALISENNATTNGGGVALNGSTLDMFDNAAITNNSATNAGGGIITFANEKNGFLSLIRMNGNALISKNSAKIGGGIFLQGELVMEDTSKITGNTATAEGGGVIAGSVDSSLKTAKTASISGNKAPKTPDK